MAITAHDRNVFARAVGSLTVANKIMDLVEGDSDSVTDDGLMTLGTDGDIAMLNRSSALNANTTLTSVILGTPVTQGVAANSLIVSNVTANGDILFAVNVGGNSLEALLVDTSASKIYLGHGALDTVIADGTGLNIGSASQLTISNGDGSTNLTPEVQVIGTTKTDASMLLAAFNTTDDTTVAPSLNFLKSGHGTVGSNTVVASGEVLGEVNFFGADGTDFESCAVSIRGLANATAGTGDMPGRLSIFTSTDGAETPTERVRVTGTATASTLALGIAGATTGTLTLAGTTSGVVTINPAAAAGTWTLTLPADDGDAGEQLQTDGNGVSTWEAAGSMRAVKNILEVLDAKAEAALERIKSRSVYAFQYKPDARKTEHLPALSDTQTVFHGVMADEYREVMMWGGKIFNPISAFGELALAVKALAAKIERLESVA